MITKEDEVKVVKQNPSFVHADIRRRNAENNPGYSKAEKAYADELKAEIDNAYMGATVYFPNYREKFIAIKVEKPGANKARISVQLLNKKLANLGIEIKEMRSNVIYRIPKVA